MCGTGLLRALIGSVASEVSRDPSPSDPSSSTGLSACTLTQSVTERCLGGGAPRHLANSGALRCS